MDEFVFAAEDGPQAMRVSEDEFVQGVACELLQNRITVNMIMLATEGVVAALRNRYGDSYLQAVKNFEKWSAEEQAEMELEAHRSIDKLHKDHLTEDDVNEIRTKAAEVKTTWIVSELEEAWALSIVRERLGPEYHNIIHWCFSNEFQYPGQPVVARDIVPRS